MADNSLRTPGSGESIATDDIGGVKFPRSKLVVGADGAAVDVEPPDSDAQAASSLLPAGGLVYNGATWDRVREATADGLAATGLPAPVPMLYNGATFDRERGNTSGVLLASAARTAVTNTATQTNHNARGVYVTLNVSSVGTGSLTLSVLNATQDSGNWVVLAAMPAYTAAAGVGYTTLLLYPGCVEVSSLLVGNVSRAVARPLPRLWLASVTPADGSSWTYDLEYDLIV